MELEINLVCTELDGLLADFLARWAADLGLERDAADLERLYCMYPRVVSQIASARASLWGADQTMAVARNLRYAPPQTLDMRAVPGAGGCGHPCSSGMAGVYVARPGERDCGCAEREAQAATAAERDVIRPTDRDFDREVATQAPRGGSRNAGRSAGRDGGSADDQT